MAPVSEKKGNEQMFVEIKEKKGPDTGYLVPFAACIRPYIDRARRGGPATPTEENIV